MTLLLGLLIFSFIVTSILIVPFINTLYTINFQRRKQKTLDALGKRTPIFDRFHKGKAGTPVGGGLLVIMVVTVLFFVLFPLIARLGVFVTHVYPINQEIMIIFTTFILFGALGLYDDAMKMLSLKDYGFFGLRLKHKLIIEILIGLIISLMLIFSTCRF